MPGAKVQQIQAFIVKPLACRECVNNTDVDLLQGGKGKAGSAGEIGLQGLPVSLGA